MRAPVYTRAHNAQLRGGIVPAVCWRSCIFRFVVATVLLKILAQFISGSTLRAGRSNLRPSHSPAGFQQICSHCGVVIASKERETYDLCLESIIIILDAVTMPQNP